MKEMYIMFGTRSSWNTYKNDNIILKWILGKYVVKLDQYNVERRNLVSPILILQFIHQIVSLLYYFYEIISLIMVFKAAPQWAR
jgi:hypothetical protein